MLAALLAVGFVTDALWAQKDLVFTAQQHSSIVQALIPAIHAQTSHAGSPAQGKGQDYEPAAPEWRQALTEADAGFAAESIPAPLRQAWAKSRALLIARNGDPAAMQDLLTAWRTWQDDSELQQRHAAWTVLLLASLAGIAMLATLASARLRQDPQQSACLLENAIDAARDGDLTQVLAQGRSGIWGRLESHLEAMNNGLSCRVAQIRNNSAVVAMSGHHLASNIDELADRTEQQAHSLLETTASVEDLNAIVTRNAEAANDADKVAERVQQLAESGNVAMLDAMQKVRQLEVSSREMGDIISAIDAIAFQTNILALNAAVEAARAGPQGRSFAVVATEVRNLAHRSASSAAQVRTLIHQSSRQVDAAAQRIEQVGATLETIVRGIRELAVHVSSIACGGKEQCSALQQMSTSLLALKALTGRNAEMVHHSAGSAREMELRTRSLSDALRMIRLRQGSADEARALVESACTLIDRVGTAQAVHHLQDRQGPFFDRDMYIFIFDRDGIFRAFGPNPAITGRHMRHVDGLQWEHLLEEAFTAIDQAPGWVDYSTINPTTGKVTEKMSYLQPLPGDLRIGCGVYKA